MKLGYFTLLVAIILLVSSSLVNARKKKKTPKAAPKTTNPKDVRPSRINPELYCDACQAIVAEAQKKLFGKTSESDVVEALEGICDPELYYTYSKKP